MKYVSALFLCFLLAACATRQTPIQNDAEQFHETDRSLAEASYAISRSSVDLAETAQAASPIQALAPPPSPSTYGMGGLTSVDWSGPVEPLIRQIARSANYRVRVLGTEPAIPVMVTIYAKNSLLGDILRDVGYQCGKRASVVVFPASQVIELRYAKN